jgi:hypothetical protein
MNPQWPVRNKEALAIGAGTEHPANPVKVDGGLNSKNYDPYCCGDGPGQGTTNN